MLATQQLAMYYLSTVVDYVSEKPKGILGDDVYSFVPADASGHECSQVYVWCVNAYWEDSFWARLQLPSRRTFVRYMQGLGITRRTSTYDMTTMRFWKEGYLHIRSVRLHCRGLLKEIRTQLDRYRDNKKLVYEHRASKQTPDRQGVTLI
jgi:hypothetical protein